MNRWILERHCKDQLKIKTPEESSGQFRSNNNNNKNRKASNCYDYVSFFFLKKSELKSRYCTKS